MNLSKAFNTITPELLLAKPHEYGLNEDAIETIHNYLKSRYQRMKINKFLIFGVKSFWEYHKVLFLDHFSLIFI